VLKFDDDWKMTVSDSRDLRNVMDETKDCHEFDASMIID
jgi:hypothetical protein